MEYEEIFASPAEPCLARISKSWDAKILNNMVEEWIEHFKNLSKTSPRDRIWKNTLPFLVISESVVQLIFLISEKLEQPNEVRYLTVELYDRFMMRHFSMLHESIYKKPTAKQTDRTWERVVYRVQNQTLLRLMSCMQLASKLIAHYQALSPKRVRQFLTEAGHSFTTSSIMSSEMRVYKTLDFKLPLSSPLVYVETLLAYLLKEGIKWNSQDNGEEAFELLYGASLQVLDVAFIMHQELYCNLFWMVTGKKGPVREQRYYFKFLNVMTQRQYAPYELAEVTLCINNHLNGKPLKMSINLPKGNVPLVVGNNHVGQWDQFMCVECDNLLLAAGVISCAANFHCPQGSDLTERVLLHLSYTTGIPKNDIAEFAVILSHVSLGRELP